MTSAGFGFGTGSNNSQPPGSGFGFGSLNNASQPATTQSQDTTNTKPIWSISSSGTSDPFKQTGSSLFGNASSPQAFGFSQSTAQQPSTGFALGNKTSTTTTTTGDQATSFPAFGGFGASGTPSTSTSLFGANSNFVGFKAPNSDSSKAPVTTAPITTSTGFTLGSSKTEPSSNFGLFGSAKTQSGFGFGGTQTTAASSNLGFGSTPSTTASSGFTLPGSSQPTQDANKKEGTAFGATSNPNFSGFNLAIGFNTTTTASGSSLFPKLGSSLIPSTKPNLFSPSVSTPTVPSVGGLFKDTTATATGASLLPSAASTSKPLPTFTKPQLQQPVQVTSSAAGSSASIISTTQASTSSSLSFSTPSLLLPKTSTTTQPKTTVPIITATLPTPATSTASIVKPVLSSTTTTTATTSASDQIPSWLKNNNIEGIIKKWTTDLDNCTKKFHNQVREVNQWDQKIIENNGRVTRLAEQLNKADSLQAEINTCLNGVEARQQELERVLTEYEEKFGDPSLEAMNPLDKEREKTYELAESINQELDNMSQILSAMITDMNLVKILNSHLTSLQWIDATANQLNARVQEAQSFLDHASSKTQEIGLDRS
ncbi:23662_t:CDS:10 [Cetraspora pellucida]|uniref:23662_t:CDS:1 n=1 Tax=Cetraspora pellucida TaxID=1433469 RepID=A0A9N9ET66_9GLOM|nr:23662_t:CDS:10 [Cetraspora pellucida]